MSFVGFLRRAIVNIHYFILTAAVALTMAIYIETKMREREK